MIRPAAARFGETYYRGFLSRFRDQPFYDAPDMVSGCWHHAAG
ncbi:MAG: hypothetical protein R2874_12740 [Desulfobacterales bacterium]